MLNLCCRGNYPPAAEYAQHADRSTASLVEIFRNMQIEEDEHLENGGLDYEAEVNFSSVLYSFLNLCV